MEIPNNVTLNPNKYAPPNDAPKIRPKFMRVIPAGTLTNLMNNSVQQGGLCDLLNVNNG